jgi:hypothetical protein
MFISVCALLLLSSPLFTVHAAHHQRDAWLIASCPTANGDCERRDKAMEKNIANHVPHDIERAHWG